MTGEEVGGRARWEPDRSPKFGDHLVDWQPNVLALLAQKYKNCQLRSYVAGKPTVHFYPQIVSVQFYFSSDTEVVPETHRRHWQIYETI